MIVDHDDAVTTSFILNLLSKLCPSPFVGRKLQRIMVEAGVLQYPIHLSVDLTCQLSLRYSHFSFVLATSLEIE